MFKGIFNYCSDSFKLKGRVLDSTKDFIIQSFWHFKWGILTFLLTAYTCRLFSGIRWQRGIQSLCRWTCGCRRWSVLRREGGLLCRSSAGWRAGCLVFWRFRLRYRTWWYLAFVTVHIQFCLHLAALGPPIPVSISFSWLKVHFKLYNVSKV